MCSTRYLSQHDLAVLTRFVAARTPGAASDDPVGRRLAALLESSIVLPETDSARRHVSLGATVRYRAQGERDTNSILIACPQDANALLARVSILTPLALGLLGHEQGRSVRIDLPLARSQIVDIVEVRPPCTGHHLVR
ncbi:GreA/GreB family elongation factor [Massilia consociata]|uniref:GreA/GreB family elongation factor n=1 Tax=Massilia consociata TaxID=760117 RepID=A0ABV6FAA8_9BURK